MNCYINKAPNSKTGKDPFSCDIRDIWKSILEEKSSKNLLSFAKRKINVKYNSSDESKNKRLKSSTILLTKVMISNNVTQVTSENMLILQKKKQRKSEVSLKVFCTGWKLIYRNKALMLEIRKPRIFSITTKGTAIYSTVVTNVTIIL